MLQSLLARMVQHLAEQARVVLGEVERIVGAAASCSKASSLVDVVLAGGEKLDFGRFCGAGLSQLDSSSGVERVA